MAAKDITEKSTRAEDNPEQNRPPRQSLAKPGQHTRAQEGTEQRRRAQDSREQTRTAQDSAG